MAGPMRGWTVSPPICAAPSALTSSARLIDVLAAMVALGRTRPILAISHDFEGPGQVRRRLPAMSAAGISRVLASKSPQARPCMSLQALDPAVAAANLCGRISPAGRAGLLADAALSNSPAFKGSPADLFKTVRCSYQPKTAMADLTTMPPMRVRRISRPTAARKTCGNWSAGGTRDHRVRVFSRPC